MTRRFFAPPSAIRDGTARLPPDELHHLRDVLRLAPGTPVEVFDGAGSSYTGIVQGEGAATFVGALVAAPVRAEAGLEMTVALALIRPERFEWALEKLTELGVRAIVPVRAERSEVRLPESRIDARRERWERIVRNAAKQSRRTRIPDIGRPCTVAELVAESAAETDRVILAESGGGPWPAADRLPARSALAVGPEGGWTAAELQAAVAGGWRPVTLGARILRTETAAVAALAIAMFRAGDLGLGVRPQPG